MLASEKTSLKKSICHKNCIHNHTQPKFAQAKIYFLCTEKGMQGSNSEQIYEMYGKYISIDVERTPPVLAKIYLATMSYKPC